MQSSPLFGAAPPRASPEMPIIPGRSSPSPPCLLRLPSLVPLSQTCPYLCFSQLHETRPSSLSSTSHPSYGCQIRLPRVRSARPDLPERLPHPAGDEPHQNQMSRRAIVRVARVLDHDYKAVVFQFCQLRNKVCVVSSEGTQFYQLRVSAQLVTALHLHP